MPEAWDVSFGGRLSVLAGLQQSMHGVRAEAYGAHACEFGAHSRPLGRTPSLSYLSVPLRILVNLRKLTHVHSAKFRSPATPELGTHSVIHSHRFDV